MTSSTAPQVIAEASGVVVAQVGPRILVIDRRLGGLATTTFVLCLLVGIPGAAAIGISVGPVLTGDAPLAFSLVLLALSLIALVLLLFTRRAVRRRRARPLDSYQPVAVFDRAAGLLLDGAGNPVAPLAAVRIARRLQVTSSSPKLVAEVNGHTYDLARGNPFAGGLGGLEQALAGALRSEYRAGA